MGWAGKAQMDDHESGKRQTEAAKVRGACRVNDIDEAEGQDGGNDHWQGLYGDGHGTGRQEAGYNGHKTPTLRHKHREQTGHGEYDNHIVVVEPPWGKFGEHSGAQNGQDQSGQNALGPYQLAGDPKRQKKKNTKQEQGPDCPHEERGMMRIGDELPKKSSDANGKSTKRDQWMSAPKGVLSRCWMVSYQPCRRESHAPPPYALRRRYRQKTTFGGHGTTPHQRHAARSE